MLVSYQIFNVILRGFTLASRLILIFVLARFLKPSEVGLFGVVSSGIGYGTLIVGAEFYNYSTRLIRKNHYFNNQKIVINHLTFLILSYLVVISFIMVLYVVYGFNTISVFYMFLIFFEVISQELSRFLMMFNKQLKGSIILFVRGGAWPLVLSILFIYFPQSRTIDSIFLFWMFSSFISAILALFFIIQEIGIPSNYKLDSSWIQKGLRSIVPMIIVALTFQGFFTLDKFVFKFLHSSNALGAYVFFITITSSMLTLLDSGVTVFFLPKLLDASLKETLDSFDLIMKSYTRNVLFFSFILFACYQSFGFILVTHLDVSNYLQFFYLYKWILSAVVIFAISTVPHLGLFALGRDKLLMRIHFLSFLIWILMVYLLRFYLKELTVPITLCVTFFIMLLAKTICFQYARIKHVQILN